MTSRQLQWGVVGTVLLLTLAGLGLSSLELTRSGESGTKEQNPVPASAPVVKLPALVKVFEGSDPFHLLAAPAPKKGKKKQLPGTVTRELVVPGGRLRVYGVFISEEEQGAVFALPAKVKGSVSRKSRSRGQTRPAQEKEVWVSKGGRIAGYVLKKVEPGVVTLVADEGKREVRLEVFAVPKK